MKDLTENPPATPEPAEPATQANPADLLTGAAANVPAAEPSGATVANPGELFEQAKPTAAPPPAEPKPTTATLPPGKGKGFRNLSDYARLDWSKPNATLAKQAGVSRQRIYQIRKELEKLEKAGQKVEPSAIDPGETQADFSDLTGITGGAPEAAPAAGPTLEAVQTDYTALAYTTFDMSTSLASMLIGPEWQPRVLETPGGGRLDERETTVQALANYYRSIQAKDLPPGVLLAFVIVGYAGPRFTVDNTRNKFKLSFAFLKVKLGGMLSKWRNRRGRVQPLTIVKTETNKTDEN
jgi:DNA-binding XRE family transcriptional regulator